MRKSSLLIVLSAWVLLAVTGYADTFQMANGETLTGEPLTSSANDQGMQIKTADGKYERIPWINFSQDELKKFKENPKLAPLVDPFIEVTQEERIKKTEVKVNPPPRLERPAHKFFFSAMFSSGPGLMILLLLYASVIYAGYEVAIFRAQPVALVTGLSAIPFLGLLAPIIFLSMPTRFQKEAPSWDATAQPTEGGTGAPTSATAAAASDTVNPMQAEGVEHPTALKLHHEENPKSLPEPTVFQRGQYTFNKRFIETKFAGFFSVVRREADKDMVLVFKTARGEYTAQRISRIGGNDLHLQVQKGAASEEVLVPFQEIKEIILKHKDAA